MKTVSVWGLSCIALTACSPALVLEESKIAQAQAQDIRCRQETPTGSHLMRRVCTTKAQRDAQTAQAREDLEKAMEQQRNQAMMNRSDRRMPSRP
jgi:hypothetical protein